MSFQQLRSLRRSFYAPTVLSLAIAAALGVSTDDALANPPTIYGKINVSLDSFDHEGAAAAPFLSAISMQVCRVISAV